MIPKISHNSSGSTLIESTFWNYDTLSHPILKRMAKRGGGYSAPPRMRLGRHAIFRLPVFINRIQALGILTHPLGSMFVFPGS